MVDKCKILNAFKLLVAVCGGWWSIMSGAISIPFGLAALFMDGRGKTIFAVLAFCALWVFALRLTWKNYEILAIQNPAKKAALFTKMVDFIKASEEQDAKAKKSASISDYVQSLQPHESIGALIKFADEIQTEEDLEWFCCEFENLGYKAPLKDFKPVLEHELKGQWLPVLREARLRPEEIMKQTQFLSFLGTIWSGKEKWRRGHDQIWENEAKLHEL